MNILILSCGTRNKIVSYFKTEIGKTGKVVAADCSEIAPALYEADMYYIVSRITDPEYIDEILEICRKEKIDAVLSLIDPELSLLAKNKERFKSIGVTVIGSDYEQCELALNKHEMYKWLVSHNYNCAKTYVNVSEFYNDLDEGKIFFPVFVKPVCGSASVAISKVGDKETLEVLLKNNESLMIQEFLNGQEIGADCYIDIISKKVVSIFTKKKLVMRAGETDKSVSFKDENLFMIIKSFCEEFGFSGQVDIDIFEIEGKYYISEVNPRFGGGYPHAYECGCNNIKLILNNLNGITNVVNIADYESDIYMMKYNDIKFLKK